MPDSIAYQPITPPPSAMDTISGLLGIKAKQQALETGQFTQQSAQASAQNDSRIADEQSRIAAYVSNPANKGKKAADMADDINSIAPTTGQAYLANRVGLEQKETELKSAQSKLSEDNKGAAASVIGSFVGSKFKNADLANQMDVATKANPQLAPVLSHYKDLLLSGQIPDTDGNTPNPQRDALVNQATTSLGGKSPLTGGLTDTGPTLNQTTTNANTGAVTVGAPAVTKGLSPTQTPGYVRATAAAGQEGGKGAANDEDLYNDVVAKGAKASQVKGLSQDISKLADEVKTGTYTKAAADKWATISQMFGVSPDDTSQTTRRMLLGKYAAQLALQQEQANGASTDAAQANVHSAMPDPEHMDPEAIKAAARFVGGQADLAAARAKVANAQRQRNGGTSTGLRAVDSQFMQTADPRQFVYKDLPPGPERQKYLREHFANPKTGQADPVQVQDFLDKKAVTEHFVGGQ